MKYKAIVWSGAGLLILFLIFALSLHFPLSLFEHDHESYVGIPFPYTRIWCCPPEGVRDTIHLYSPYLSMIFWLSMVSSIYLFFHIQQSKIKLFLILLLANLLLWAILYVIFLYQPVLVLYKA